MEQANEHRNLGEHRQAARYRPDASFLVDALHLLRCLGLVIGVFGAQFLNLRLDLLHLARGAQLRDGRLDHERLQRPRQEDDGDDPRSAPTGVEDEAQKPMPEPQNG